MHQLYQNVDQAGLKIIISNVFIMNNILLFYDLTLVGDEDIAQFHHYEFVKEGDRAFIRKLREELGVVNKVNAVNWPRRRYPEDYLDIIDTGYVDILVQRYGDETAKFLSARVDYQMMKKTGIPLEIYKDCFWDGTSKALGFYTDLMHRGIISELDERVVAARAVLYSESNLRHIITEYRLGRIEGVEE